MKFQKNLLIIYTIVSQGCILFGLEMTSTKLELGQAIEQQLTKEQLHHFNPQFVSSSNDTYHPLKRKRRYLEFPEGSSFQLVYDLIVGVVDFTNYLILGVTVALAWELPSKPPSEIFEDLSERLKDGTLGTSRNDSIQNIKYFDHKNSTTAIEAVVNRYKYKLKPLFRPPMHYQYYTPISQNGFIKRPLSNYSPNSRFNSPQQYRKQNLFFSQKQTHPFAKWTKTNKYPKSNIKGIQYPWWNLPDRLKNSFVAHPSIRRFDKNINKNRFNQNNYRKTGAHSKFQGTGRSEHRIFPVFGKRSISAKHSSSIHQRHKRNGIATELPSKLDRFHIEHHRRTRHDLYQRIETYINGRGSHGHHCVLRALCETGQKSNEQIPGTFVGELMRAIFTIPEHLDFTADRNKYVGDKVRRYDVAHAEKEDCSRRYNQCKESLWASHFVL